MSKDIELQLQPMHGKLNPENNDLDDTLFDKNNTQTQKTPISSRRKTQHIVLFSLVCTVELITIFLGLLLVILDSQDVKYAYLTFIIFTVVRVIIFLVSSIQLCGGITKDLFLLYFCLDNVILMMLASDVTYIFLNAPKKIQYIELAMISYPILCFFLTGNSRVMLQYAIWSPPRVIIYKIIKIIGSTFYLVYGCYMILNGNSNELFLLWIFTTCAFWAEMCFQINTKDGSDNMKTDYIIADDDDQD